MKKQLTYLIIAMGAIILISNILVQYTVGNWLTWATFTYPIVFLITDITNRKHGIVIAQKVVVAGFLFGIIASIAASVFDATTLRIAIGSATAFLVAQLLDVAVFDKLRNIGWWKTPIISSFIGSVVDTAIFFTIAFSGFTLAIMTDGNNWALEGIPLLGFGPIVPLWVSLATADLLVKIIILPILLIPYRLLIGKKEKIK